MAFTKTSVAVTAPQVVSPPSTRPAVGERRVDDLGGVEVWDGKTWVPENDLELPLNSPPEEK